VHGALGQEGEDGGANVAAARPPAAAVTAPVAAAELGAAVKAGIAGDPGIAVSMSAMHI
jgi:hypothetical protein